ncbi:hypothetical protein DVH24_002362 [Malus domestica]|uniref:Uncharacterized protein n=1 Tax=Malus domestica TaxID=3750 RepID=A0A498I9G5_MALDO|nr:hypothetical protein DVH24_002362 [Malus domestica]
MLDQYWAQMDCMHEDGRFGHMCVQDKHMQRSPHANSRQEREKTHAKKPTCKVKTKLMAKVKELVSKKRLRVLGSNGRHDIEPSAIALYDSYSQPHLVGKSFVVVRHRTERNSVLGFI